MFTSMVYMPITKMIGVILGKPHIAWSWQWCQMSTRRYNCVCIVIPCLYQLECMWNTLPSVSTHSWWVYAWNRWYVHVPWQPFRQPGPMQHGHPCSCFYQAGAWLLLLLRAPRGLVGICRGFVRQLFPHPWGIWQSLNANPHIAPPGPVLGGGGA